jgi:FkbM family methyltransferase
MNIVSTKVNLANKENIFSYREDSLGDKGVVNQIFVNRDYEISNWEQGRRLIEYHKKIIANHHSLIVDAGANIGASAVFFANSYENSLIFAIEPDEMNWHLLSMNTASLNCFNFLGAISSEDGELVLIDPGLSDWGFRTKNVEGNHANNVKKTRSICPASIINHEAVKNTKPLIFKIDIEGGEENLFSKNIEWMKFFPLIIIELHDWMLPFSGSAKNFLKAIAQYDFDLVHRGENIFLFNRDILK